MQNLQISDSAASVLYELAESEHISAETLMERLVTAHKEEIIKKNELKTFFQIYQKDMRGFTFNREEANER